MRAACLILSFASLPTAFCTAQAPTPNPVPDAELVDELASAPLENPDRVARLKALYEQAGAPPEAITLQEVPGRRDDDPLLHNVIVTKPGTTGSVIVVGGHLDKVPAGAGVIDDWSGACMASNLYQALKDVPTEHTFVFMGFAYEEQGLVGSRIYVDQLGEEGAANVRAMVNLEVLGVGGPFLWTNGSNDALEAIAHRVAEEHDLALEDHVIPGVGADSIPFEDAGIPTITFDGLPVDRFELIHSDKDQFENVDQEAYTRTYALVLRYLLELDRSEEIPDHKGDGPDDLPASPDQE
ncbi:M28 family metallopeptidase [Tautonia plasticadhaerens]|uniref:Aminopeptidase YwaD n=1 Tax=Tautonia plasticadhaerens TaxID=2527974 RepID=A0A518GY98_9BACT|nr:M28 family peptidase [Tautonia plasticadhaerens]QDV33522.1 Aminopeptidase YwaD precursor [Tautonia plasticadhaerens]